MLQPTSKLDAIATAVIGAALEVHRILGPGFLEGIYEEALAIELELRGINFQRQEMVAVSYKGREIGEGRTDFVIEGALILELKAVDRLTSIHQAQVLSYLKATGYQLGLLMNFHERLLRDGLKRIILTRPPTLSPSS
jgi:GxxExxY protein